MNALPVPESVITATLKDFLSVASGDENTSVTELES
jgi:hypothetical protein